MNVIRHVLPVLCGVSLLAACSLEPKSKTARLFLNLQLGSDRDQADSNPLDWIRTAASGPLKTAPSTISSFPCYGVNVVGPGIADTARHPETNFNMQAFLQRQTYCGYRGVVAGSFMNTGVPVDVSLQVPAGPSRVVQIIGITPLEACPTALLPDDSGGVDSEVYELGRFTGDLFSDRAITITADYPEGGSDGARDARRVNCGDPGANGCSLSSGGQQETGGLVLTASEWGAQRVSVASPSYLKQIDLYLGGSMLGQNVTVEVMTDSSGNPGTVVNASLGLATTNVPASSAQWVQFDFGSPGNYHLLAPGTYWIVVKPSASSIRWHSGSSGTPGGAKIFNGTWIATSRVMSPVSAATSYVSTCYTGSSRMSCWGYNLGGELGDGSPIQTVRAFPGSTNVLGGATSVALGNEHGCGINGSGALYCWGKNSSGQLGDGTTTDRPVPVPISALTSGTMEVSASPSHTCAWKSGGMAYCWGDNAYGQVGDGTQISRSSPTMPSGLSNGVTQIAVGNLGSCAVVNGAAKCWGYNNEGQVGDGTIVTRMTPTQVAGLTSGVTGISVGNFFACAVQTGGVKCWGVGTNGQLGNGSATSSLTPVSVTGLPTASKVVTGESFACALTASGGVYCWGAGVDGQMGQGNTNGSSSPVPVTGMSSGVTDLFAGSGANHVCAIQNGNLYCWGDGAFGQMGQGSGTADGTVPTLVRGADEFAYRFYSCSS